MISTEQLQVSDGRIVATLRYGTELLSPVLHSRTSTSRRIVHESPKNIKKPSERNLKGSTSYDFALHMSILNYGDFFFVLTEMAIHEPRVSNN
jgi:hypothetical protein